MEGEEEKGEEHEGGKEQTIDVKKDDEARGCGYLDVPELDLDILQEAVVQGVVLHLQVEGGLGISGEVRVRQIRRGE